MVLCIQQDGVSFHSPAVTRGFIKSLSVISKGCRRRFLNICLQSKAATANKLYRNNLRLRGTLRSSSESDTVIQYVLLFIKYFQVKGIFLSISIGTKCFKKFI